MNRKQYLNFFHPEGNFQTDHSRKQNKIFESRPWIGTTTYTQQWKTIVVCLLQLLTVTETVSIEDSNSSVLWLTWVVSLSLSFGCLWWYPMISVAWTETRSAWCWLWAKVPSAAESVGAAITEIYDDCDDGHDVSVNKCNMNPCIILIRKVPALKDIDSQSLFILKYEF